MKKFHALCNKLIGHIRSGSWIQEKYITKFELCKYGDKYGFSLYIEENDSIVCSEKFNKLSCCLTRLENLKENIGTTEIYMSVDKLDGAGYKKYGEILEEPSEKEIVEEPIEEKPIEEEPIVEEPVEEEPIEEEPTLPKKCIVGIMWPESSNPDKIYRYNAGEMRINVGDTVVVPTYDSFNQREVVSKARVICVEFYEEGEDVNLPKKSIISAERGSI